MLTLFNVHCAFNDVMLGCHQELMCNGIDMQLGHQTVFHVMLWF